MFTGIVEGTGPVRGREETADGLRLRLGTPFEGLEVGQSICVSGVCLTAEAVGNGWVDVFLAAETRERSYLGDLDVGDAVNLERAMPADGRFDGHIVQGHVDGTGEVRALEEVGEDWQLRVSIPSDLERYVVEKGSLAVDGVSLTVAGREAGAAEAAIIPETYRRTTLSGKAVGEPVHLEADVIAKYVERQLGADSG